MDDAYLLTWNPQKYDWQDLPQLVRKLTNAKSATTTWSCGNRKNIAKGSRVFLHRQGAAPRGIVGCGRTVEIPKEYDSWRSNGTKTSYVKVRWEILSEEPLIHEAQLKQGLLSKVHWSTQRSGICIPQGAQMAMEHLLLQGLHCHMHGNAEDAAAEELHALEGEARTRMVTHRTRERGFRNRKLIDAVKKNGGRLVCEVSDSNFDFEQSYGKIGIQYAQVHHLRPLAEYKGAEKTSLKDLAIVCANCHAMIHRGGKSRPLSEIKIRRTASDHAAGCDRPRKGSRA
jgi:hypothetical protein